MTNAFTLTVDEQGIGQLVFDLPNEKVNKINIEVLDELDQKLNEIKSNKAIQVLLIASAKPDIFIAGADLHQFEPMFLKPDGVRKLIQRGHDVFWNLQNLSIPTIALIDGACLGGGLELALACTYRIVTDNPKVQIGLPEVTLGIFPGWGGTQRLPRLIGLTDGLGMIISGKPVNGVKAYKTFLADGIAASPFLLSYAKDFAKKILSKQGKTSVLARRILPWWKKALESYPVASLLVFPRVRKEILKKTKGNYPAPLITLDLIHDSYYKSLKQGLHLERERFIHCIPELAENAQNLISLFFTSEAIKKDPGAAPGTKTLPVQRGAVLGAGTMGGGIAWLFANKDIPVRMKDINWEAIGKGFSQIAEIFYQLVKIRKMKPAEAMLKFHRATGGIDYNGFDGCDLIIEAATENLDLKRQIFQELELHIKPSAIVATNTSSLTVAQMESAFKNPERFLGLHFFNPVNRMPLVEVVAGKYTAQETIATAVEFVKKAGKTPIVVKDCPGFLVNRIFMPGANQVIRLLEEGVDFKRLERFMLHFGMPMSPFELCDEVGNDVTYKVSSIFENAYGERMKAPRLLKEMYDQKLLGKKVKAGFYLYQGKEKQINPAAAKLYQQSNASSDTFSDDDLRDRIFLPMVNEASRCLEENIVSSPQYLDMALIMGIGFPPFRGGVLAFADQLGLPYIVDRLHHFERTEGATYAPSNFLVNLVQSGRTFYP